MPATAQTTGGRKMRFVRLPWTTDDRCMHHLFIPLALWIWMHEYCRIYMFYSIIHRIGKSLFLLHPSWSHGFYMDERTKRTACLHIANIPQQHHQIKSFWPISSLKLNTHFLLLSFFLSKFDRWPLSTQKCFWFGPACERKRARIDACLVPMTRSISEYSYTFHLAVQRIYRWKISRIMANQYNTITLAGCRSVVATG